MKILFDYQAFTQRYGGISRYHIELIKGLPKHNFHVDIPKIISENAYLEALDIHCQKRRIWVPSKFRAAVTAKMNQIICKNAYRKQKFDIFHPTFVNPYYDKIKSTKPLVITVHDLIQEKTQRYDAGITSRRRKRQLEKADAIICVSQQTKDDLLHFYPQFFDKKITVIYHGADLSTPVFSNDRAIQYPYILYVGSREGYKNFDNFIKAFSLLPKDIHLICTGHQFNNTELIKINELSLQNRVHQIFVSDKELVNLYHYAKVFVYPSTMEGFGIPILEAFRCKCPVIASDIKCFHEVGDNAVTYFDPNDIEAISYTIKDFLFDSYKRNRSIKLGQERLKLFSWENSVKNHANLYNELI